MCALTLVVRGIVVLASVIVIEVVFHIVLVVELVILDVFAFLVILLVVVDLVDGEPGCGQSAGLEPLACHSGLAVARGCGNQGGWRPVLGSRYEKCFPGGLFVKNVFQKG